MASSTATCPDPTGGSTACSQRQPARLGSPARQLAGAGCRDRFRGIPRRAGCQATRRSLQLAAPSRAATRSATRSASCPSRSSRTSARQNAMRRRRVAARLDEIEAAEVAAVSALAYACIVVTSLYRSRPDLGVFQHRRGRLFQLLRQATPGVGRNAYGRWICPPTGVSWCHATTSPDRRPHRRSRRCPDPRTQSPQHRQPVPVALSRHAAPGGEPGPGRPCSGYAPRSSGGIPRRSRKAALGSVAGHPARGARLLRVAGKTKSKGLSQRMLKNESRKDGRSCDGLGCPS